MRRRRLAVVALMLLAACRDRLVGFDAAYDSGVVSPGHGPSDGARLRFIVRDDVERITGRSLRLSPERALLHIQGYLPLTPDSLGRDALGTAVFMTLPPDLIALTAPRIPVHVTVRGRLYLPGEPAGASPSGPSGIPPDALHTTAVTLSAVYAGPITNLEKRLQDFLRGLYVAR